MLNNHKVGMEENPPPALTHLHILMDLALEQKYLKIHFLVCSLKNNLCMLISLQEPN
jgi:hypothetical protein